MSRIRGIALLGLVLSAVSTAFAGGLSLPAGPPSDPALVRALATANRSIGARRDPADNVGCPKTFQIPLSDCSQMVDDDSMARILGSCPNSIPAGMTLVYNGPYQDPVAVEFTLSYPCWRHCWELTGQACHDCCVNTNSVYDTMFTDEDGRLEGSLGALLCGLWKEFGGWQYVPCVRLMIDLQDWLDTKSDWYTQGVLDYNAAQAACPCP